MDAREPKGQPLPWDMMSVYVAGDSPRLDFTRRGEVWVCNIEIQSESGGPVEHAEAVLMDPADVGHPLHIHLKDRCVVSPLVVLIDNSPHGLEPQVDGTKT